MNKPISLFLIVSTFIAISAGFGQFFGLVGAADAEKLESSSNTRRTIVQATLLPSNLSNDPDTSVKILEINDKSLILELITPFPQVAEVSSVSGACQILNIEGYATYGEPGWPQLPVIGSLIGIPVISDPNLEILDFDVAVLPEKYDLCPVATPKTSIDMNGQIQFNGYEYLKNVLAYEQNLLSPIYTADILSTGFIRSQRAAQVIFHPFQYNALMGELRYFPRIRIRFNFNSPSEYRLPGANVAENGFETILANTLLNYTQARSWRVAPIPSTNSINQVSDEDQPAIKLLIEDDGMYQVTYEDLLTAGVKPEILDTLNPSTFQLFTQGEEVAILVSGEQDGFDPEDFIIFYGKNIDTRYTNTNIYWLKWGNDNGLRMEEIDGTPDGTATIPSAFPLTLALEQDNIYLSSIPSGIDNDRWYWDNINATSSPITKNYSFTIPQLTSTTNSVSVRGHFKGYDAVPYHHTIVQVNGHLIVDSNLWAAHDEYIFEVSIPQAYLLEGDNILRVTAPLDQGITRDIFYVNWFEVDYSAPFIAINDQLKFKQFESGNLEFQVTGFTSDEIIVVDISNPLVPIRVTGVLITQELDDYTLDFQLNLTEEHEYLSLSTNQIQRPVDIILDTPSDLHSLSNSTDLIVISHGDFITEAQLLSDFRNDQGLLSMVVDVQDIYDEFNWGIFDPQAIHDFLVYAYTHWAPRKPAFVLLFGDGNYDFRNNYGFGEINYVPPYLANVDPWIGETAADNRYVTVSGDDLLADMHLGRLPVKSSLEAGQVVRKIIYNETISPVNVWSQQMVFVADNADSAGDFAAMSDIIVNEYLPDPYTAQKIYFGITHPNASDVRSAVINAINQGRLAVNYIGHAAYWVWGQEQLFSRFEIPSLTNTELFPFIVPMTCMDGYYIYPSSAEQNYSSLGESIVASTPNGAIASWSPTGFGVASGHDLLNKGLFEALFTDDVIQLGPATTLAKLYLAANSSLHNDLLDTYILFGDPATQLNVPPAEVSISKSVTPTGVLDPGDAITYTLEFTNTGITTAHHVVITDDLPDILVDPVVTSSGVAVTHRPDTAYEWEVEDIEPGETGIITITATIDPEFYGSIANSASISTSARELEHTNNTSDVITLVQRPTSTLLGSFTAASYPGLILLEWETTSEVNLTGFNLYRAPSPNEVPVKINPHVIAPETPGSGTGNPYHFDDQEIIPGETYYYWLELITDSDAYINEPISEFAYFYLHAPILLTHE